MNQRNYFFIFLTFLVWIGAALVSTLLAQNMTVQDGTEAPLSPENMISNFFLGDGVEVNSIQYEGAPEAVGFFSNGASTIGIDRGILMTTGVARSNNASIGADGVSEQESGESTEMGVTDLDVSTIVQGTATFDIAKYTIEFTPVADTLRFRYSFASEEYPEFVCSDYNDVFGFFISGPGINGTFQDGAENIALIPGTDLPVRINNVNSGMPGSQGPNINNCLPPEGSLSFPQFYNETPVGAQPVYDGYTDVFEAVIALIPCETYTLKLIIADVNDETRDSGVFLEAKSFGTGSLDVRAVTVGGDGILTEGCGEGTIEFSLANETQNDYTFNYTTFGTAEAGTDFTNIPNELTIPAGQSSVSINLEAFEDNLPEDLESIFFDVQLDICNRDTFEIFIRDNQLRIPELRDTILCPGESVVLDGDLNAIIPPDPTFTYSNSAPISPSNTAIYYP
ncbi:MAG: choice-of-anchor L domain-containing protein, partial [Saprospiraceae bacterium]